MNKKPDGYLWMDRRGIPHPLSRVTEIDVCGAGNDIGLRVTFLNPPDYTDEQTVLLRVNDEQASAMIARMKEYLDTPQEDRWLVGMPREL